VFTDTLNAFAEPGNCTVTVGYVRDNAGNETEMRDVSGRGLSFTLTSSDVDITPPEVELGTLAVAPSVVDAGNDVVVSFRATDDHSGLRGDDGEWNQNGYVYIDCPGETYHGWAQYNVDTDLIEFTETTNAFGQPGTCTVTDVGYVRDNGGNETDLVDVTARNITFTLRNP
jgi:hypothetical protein